MGWGVLTLTLEMVRLRPRDSPAGALGIKEESTSRKDTSALLVFNQGLADQEGISSTWPSSPFESPPHPKRNHLPGLWLSPAAGKTPSGWLTRQRQAHNLRHCPADGRHFPGSSPHQLHPSLLGRRQQSPSAVLIIPDLGREPTPIRRVGTQVDGAAGAF